MVHKLAPQLEPRTTVSEPEQQLVRRFELIEFKRIQKAYKLQVRRSSLKTEKLQI